MNNCEYCDYYKSIDGNNEKGNIARAVCSFTNVILFNDFFEEPKVEYPCKDMTYQKYLSSKGKKAGASKQKPGEWKFIYKSKHPVGERRKSINII
jgi:hypothetical protein